SDKVHSGGPAGGQCPLPGCHPETPSPSSRRPASPRRAAPERPPGPPSRLRAPKQGSDGQFPPETASSSHPVRSKCRRETRAAGRSALLLPAAPASNLGQSDTVTGPTIHTSPLSASSKSRRLTARTQGGLPGPPPEGPRFGRTGCLSRCLVVGHSGTRTRSKMTSILRSPQALQLTLALIKPDAVAHPVILEAVHQQILSNKFLIVRMRELLWRKEDCQKFYQEHEVGQSEPTSSPARMPSSSGGH
uniref:NME/NM23 nucleoside diphosphate kinase 6 n=1 Tax=Equus asinus TaxID=9793 RepID=A0A9L0KJN8_EQUAS